MIGMKKILVVDDSALMRSVICDIINSDKRFQVEDRATNGLEALNLLRRKQYDAVILDVNMPVMDGIELLKQLRKENISAKVLVASTDSKAGAKVTLDALELGALEFIHKPSQAAECRLDDFKKNLIRLVSVVSDGKPMPYVETVGRKKEVAGKAGRAESASVAEVRSKKVVAIASSTGGPRALQAIIPFLPKNINAPILIVQHMPKGFTASFAERLDSLSELKVMEAKENDVLQAGCVYLARGGNHMNVIRKGEKHVIHYSDEPSREGVKPCANYMFESLSNSTFEEVICVVLTGMGADGTKGIENLKTCKKVHVTVQDEESCAVYGMPKNVVKAGLADKVLPLAQIAQEITLYTGVRRNGCKPIS